MRRTPASFGCIAPISGPCWRLRLAKARAADGAQAQAGMARRVDAPCPSAVSDACRQFTPGDAVPAPGGVVDQMAGAGSAEHLPGRYTQRYVFDMYDVLPIRNQLVPSPNEAGPCRQAHERYLPGEPDTQPHRSRQSHVRLASSDTARPTPAGGSFRARTGRSLTRMRRRSEGDAQSDVHQVVLTRPVSETSRVTDKGAGSLA